MEVLALRYLFYIDFFATIFLYLFVFFCQSACKLKTQHNKKYCSFSLKSIFSNLRWRDLSEIMSTNGKLHLCENSVSFDGSNMTCRKF